MRFFNNDNIIAGISEKKDGSMKKFLDNRSFYIKKHKDLSQKIIISADLSHGSSVAVVDDNLQADTVVSSCDALITNNPKYLLIITVADCLPVYFYDKNKGVVAIAHAGWRGLVLGVATQVVDLFVSKYKSSLSDIEVFVGPHIKKCHFEVKDDVASKFSDSVCSFKDDKLYVDLAKSLKFQLEKRGIKADNISISNECTFCLSSKYFSFRRDKPKILELMMAYVGLN